MILADTTVVIDDIRGKDAKLRALIGTLTVGICGATRAEVLCGAQNAGHRAKLIAHLSAFHHLAFPDPLWDAVGDNLSALRLSGLTVPFPDAVIVTLGMHLGIEVWSRDKHFPAIQKVLPALKLFTEPP